MSNKQLNALQTILNTANDQGNKVFWTPSGDLNGENQVVLIQGNHVKMKNSKVMDARDMRSNSFSVVIVSPIVVLDMI
jgi:hypothetical protein